MGEFSDYLGEMVYYLKKAVDYTANDNQKVMVEKYIESYVTGSIEAHKDSQRKWIVDKMPIVETNMGWVETYIDPTNQRAYFEGWVAVVDKEKSKKFKQLVDNSETIIPKLPWNGLGMEKDNFLAPEFTTLEVITFATNGCPLGINIPNYDDIRENEGFKNVFLNNSMSSYVASSVQFATPEQSKILSENVIKCYEVHVACHELLGHGTGKLIYREEGKPTPTFTDPTNGETFESCYEAGELWNTKFGSISTSFEECRADACGFFLAPLPEVYTLFGIQEDEVDTMLWVNVMQQFRKGITGLNLFNAETGKWGQAHTQGAYVFSQYLL
jgi:dipeptidyl-peptidase III